MNALSAEPPRPAAAWAAGRELLSASSDGWRRLCSTMRARRRPTWEQPSRRGTSYPIGLRTTDPARKLPSDRQSDVGRTFVADLTLRPIEDSDLDALFDAMREPESVQIAAFTAKDPRRSQSVDIHMSTVRISPDTTLRAVTHDGRLVGSISASSPRTALRSPTGSTALSRDKESLAKPLPCFSTAFWSDRSSPALPATTSDRSESYEEPAFRSSARRSRRSRTEDRDRGEAPAPRLEPEYGKPIECLHQRVRAGQGLFVCRGGCPDRIRTCATACEGGCVE